MIGALPRDLGPEEQALVEMVDAVAAGHVAPLAEAVDHDREVPDAVVRTLAEQGVLAAGVPEISGVELAPRAGLLVVSRLARASASVALVAAAVHEAAAAYGARERLSGRGADWRPVPVLSGMTLERTATGPVIAGRTPRAEVGPDATHLLVTARAADGEDAVAVELDPADPRVAIGPLERTTGLRGRSVASLALDDLAVDPAAVVGGADDVRRAVTTRTLMSAAIALGIASAAADAAVAYAGERRQFGAPIVGFPAVRGHLETIAGHIATVGSLLWEAGGHDPATIEGQRAALRTAVAAVAASRSVPRLAVQVLGGYGYVEEYPVAVRLRDGASIAARAGGSERLLQQLSALGGPA